MSIFEEYRNFFFIRKENERLRLRSTKDLFHDIFIVRRTNLTVVQFLRGMLVGGVCVLSDMLILYLLVQLADIHYLLANTAAFFTGTVLNYILSITWIFTSHGNYSRQKEFIIFCIIGAIGLALNSLFMWIFTDYLGIYYMNSKIITTILVYIWNFFSRKHILFD
ncbi:MAG: GtrA family protein [Bacteroidales bacterium]|nr:GtrA family protein [Bacteroidales bacterium]